MNTKENKMEIADFSSTAKQLIDDIKGICANAGLGGDANEYKIVTQSFLYKFLNDKFLFEINKINPSLKSYDDLKSISKDDYELLMISLGTKTAHLKPEHLLENLFKRQNDSDFAKLFDDTLNDVAVDNSDVFSVHTAGNTEIRLFEEDLIQDAVNDKSKRDATARALINKLANIKFDFDIIFSAGFDFFSTLFEYMIKDYNKDGGGKYAEYFTPHSIAKIMAEILIGDDAPTNVTAYDPSAGSGTLLMNIAHKIGPDKCTIYSQDISQKSSNLLRLNLILNNLSHSIDHIVQGNTITEPKHITKKFDFVVSNPPFKLDFSDDYDKISSLPNVNDRFFAGIPNIPNIEKDKMAIYLLFIQHIMFSLSETGRAAVVVPTGFITAQNGIEKIIRTKLIEKKWLKGVVSMPSNIFATTGTNVSVILIDKANTNKVVLVDASKLGTKIRDGKNQKTVLSHAEEQKIIDAFSTHKMIDNFSVVLDYDEITAKNHSFSAGRYFDIKIEYADITPEKFEQKLAEHKANLGKLFTESKESELDIIKKLDLLKYDR
ncbi:SAM-dependent methyltransferase [Candidatus Saccharibacteria bacterium CG11_big_fil_rev_8_21_14_0_20_41_19]|nr:MAG: SAM-dependent methyltransferase [Candidatus Saccharibacteria bacterium CG11_big_fil_rev_8_21_14_0_20_41_19]PIZ60210.1 MAG: SAM-dependent methyltransferase [Candidatus Saccharibacteria bacterium CG_4_10_14_0_2_um_filter_41_11]PJC29341.1 MAG: SAM-dependent methyltransferase [Candidatus Saccharibacteria bacterium CG_4_9_14_0_2_um_filter_41_9]